MKNKIEKTHNYLNQFEDNILKLLKESKVDSFKKTLPRATKSRDFVGEKHYDDANRQFSRIENDMKIGNTPKSFDNSDLAKSNFIDQTNLNNTRPKLYVKTQVQDKSQIQKIQEPIIISPSQNILERLKQIELHYQSKINILEDDNANLRKVNKEQKAIICELEQKGVTSEKYYSQQLVEYQDKMNKTIKDIQDTHQHDMKQQQILFQKNFDKHMQRKDERIKELENILFQKRQENQLFTFKTQDL